MRQTAIKHIPVHTMIDKCQITWHQYTITSKLIQRAQWVTCQTKFESNTESGKNILKRPNKLKLHGSY